LRVLITGGAGFIGRNLAARISAGDRVKIYDDFQNSRRGDVEAAVGGAAVAEGDILDFERLVREMRGHETVVHLAAVSDVARAEVDPERARRVNVEGTRNVLNACAQNGVSRVVFASTAAVYGETGGGTDEESATSPVSLYGRTKLEAEGIVREISERHQMGYVILRIFNVYGGHERGDVVSRFLRAARDGKPIRIHGDGEQTRDFVSVEDVVRCIELAARKEGVASGVYNLGTGESCSINELAGLILRARRGLGVTHGEKPTGDVHKSGASVAKLEAELGFRPARRIRDELGEILGSIAH